LSQRIFDPAVQKAFLFIDSLRVDDGRTSYWEVAEKDHNEHKVFPQTQYMLHIIFNYLGMSQEAARIAAAHDFNEPDTIDSSRNGRPANDTYCVLEGNLKPFRFAGQKDSDYNDLMALLSLYWLEKRHAILGNWPYRKDAEAIWRKLLSRYDQSKRVLEMDPAEKEIKPSKPFPLHAVFKLALFAISARRKSDADTLDSIRIRLKEWQDVSGGWITDRTIDFQPNGVANLETTCLCIFALTD